MKVQINTNSYVFAWGKQPKGYGAWWFEIGTEQKIFTTHYSKAAQAARKYAKSKNVTSISLQS